MFGTAKHHSLLQGIIQVHFKNTKIHPMVYLLFRLLPDNFHRCKKLHLEGSNPILGRRPRKRTTSYLFGTTHHTVFLVSGERGTHARRYTRTFRATTVVTKMTLHVFAKCSNLNVSL